MGRKHPFDLPPVLFEVLMGSKNAMFWRDCGMWTELAELARRMLESKDAALEKLEREAWFKLCAHGNGEADHAVVSSIFRC